MVVPRRAVPDATRSEGRHRSLRRLRAGAIPAASASADVFSAAAGAVTQLVATTTLGAATVRVGIVSPDQIRALAKVIYSLFLPCYLFCSVIRTVSTYGVSPSLAAMPVAAAAQVFVSYAVSRAVLLPGLGVSSRGSDEAKEICLCGTFSNPGVLPLMFFDALFRNHPDATALPKLAGPHKGASMVLQRGTVAIICVGKRIHLTRP